MRFGFSLEGFLVFLLPMLINIVYFILPPVSANNTDKTQTSVIEIIEQGSRIAFVIAICVLISGKELDFWSPLLYAAMLFLSLYYIVWIRFFIGGRDARLLGTKFLFVPMPLAVFPVLYFIFAAFWLHNYIAALVMVIFGIAHNVVSYQNLYVKEK